MHINYHQAAADVVNVTGYTRYHSSYKEL